jgi:hypothetical protein
MDAPNRIPLAEILRAANLLEAEHFIADYAIGGAIAAIFYIEPFATFDIDLFYKPVNDALDAGIPAIFERLRQLGWTVEGDHLLCRNFPVQFLAGSSLTSEAVENALVTEYQGVQTKVFRPEYVVAIAVQVGRPKDRSRIAQMLEQADIDRSYLAQILDRYRLKLEL